MKRLMELLSLAVLFGGSLCFGFIGDKTVEMGLAIVAGIAGFALANLDRIASLKAAGLELKLKETIEAASAKMEDLKKIGLLLSEIGLNGYIGGGRFASADNAPRQQALMEEVEAKLEEIGATKDEIGKALRHFQKIMLGDHLSRITSKVSSSKILSEKQKTRLVALFASRNGGAQEESPESLEKILQSLAITDSEVQEYLDDYLYYYKHGRFRREDHCMKKLP